MKDRKGSGYFKAQVVDLLLVMQTSHSHLLQAEQGITHLGTRAYLMNALPHALAKAFPAYATLNHGYYAAKYYPDVPFDWIAGNKEVLCLITILTGHAFGKPEVLDRLQKAPAMQFFGSFKTCKQIKSQISKRYKTRSLRAVSEALHPDHKPKRVLANQAIDKQFTLRRF